LSAAQQQLKTAAIPADLAAALDAAPGARSAWDALAPSHRREHLEAIEEAKRLETRARRIAKSVDMLLAGRSRNVAPSVKPLAEKLLLKPGMTLAVLLAPQRIEELLGPLPEGVSIETRFTAQADAVLFFARDSKELERGLGGFASKLAPGALFWIAYPKQAGNLKSDLNRDVLQRLLAGRRFQGVAQVAVDGAWAASRFRRS